MARRTFSIDTWTYNDQAPRELRGKVSKFKVHDRLKDETEDWPGSNAHV